MSIEKYNSRGAGSRGGEEVTAIVSLRPKTTYVDEPAPIPKPQKGITSGEKILRSSKGLFGCLLPGVVGLGILSGGYYVISSNWGKYEAPKHDAKNPTDMKDDALIFFGSRQVCTDSDGRSVIVGIGPLGRMVDSSSKDQAYRDNQMSSLDAFIDMISTRNGVDELEKIILAQKGSMSACEQDILSRTLNMYKASQKINSVTIKNHDDRKVIFDDFINVSIDSLLGYKEYVLKTKSNMGEYRPGDLDVSIENLKLLKEMYASYVNRKMNRTPTVVPTDVVPEVTPVPTPQPPRVRDFSKGPSGEVKQKDIRQDLSYRAERTNVSLRRTKQNI